MNGLTRTKCMLCCISAGTDHQEWFAPRPRICSARALEREPPEEQKKYRLEERGAQLVFKSGEYFLHERYNYEGHLFSDDWTWLREALPDLAKEEFCEKFSKYREDLKVRLEPSCKEKLQALLL